MYKVLRKEDDEFITANAEMIDEEHAVFFVGDWLVLQRVVKTDQSIDLYVVDEGNPYTLLAEKVNIVNEEDILKETKELLTTEITIGDFLIKIFEEGNEGSIGIIKPGGYRVKRFK